MEIEYKGANCLSFKFGQVNVVTDPKLSIVGLKDQKVEGSVELVSNPLFIVEGEERLLIDGPGEYEVAGVAITGVSAQGRNDETSMKVAIYRMVMAGYRIAFLGHIKGALSEDQLEALGVVDILALPVGGGEYTLSAHEAAKVVGQIDPKMVIPTHYQDSSLKYPVQQDDLELFLKELAATEHSIVDKLKLKAGSSLPETLTVIEIKRT